MEISSGERGIFLDNSNGTIEYNIINDFFYSYYTYYSSTNLLKNIFNNSYEDNLMLVSYSTPVRHPLTSESATNFYSGGNLIAGNCSNSGINFSDESFPDMNHGLNYFSLSSTDYYISGEIPEDLDGHLYSLNNYWGETPQSGRFNITNGTIHYSPHKTSDPTNLVGDYTELYDIGFGLYDSVLVKMEEENFSPDELYLQAYRKEYSKQYSDAIELYIEIISQHKDSLYAASSSNNKNILLTV